MKKLKISDVIFRIFAWFWAIVTLYPLLVTVLCSFKDNNGIYGNMFALPKKSGSLRIIRMLSYRQICCGRSEIHCCLLFLQHF